MMVLCNQAQSLTVSEIFIGECDAMARVTLYDALNKGQGH